MMALDEGRIGGHSKEWEKTGESFREDILSCVLGHELEVAERNF